LVLPYNIGATMLRTKLLIFDFDGTFTNTHANSGWELIDEVLGCERDEAILRKKFNAGVMDFKSWSQESCEIYRRYGLTIERLRHIVLTHVKPTPGISEVLISLRNLGIRTGIISGSIYNIYEFFSKQYQLYVDYPHFASVFTFDSKGKLNGGEFTNYDYGGKVHVLDKIVDKLNITKAEVAMIGNDVNDIGIFERAGISIAFNPQKRIVAEAANYVVHNDMTKVLKYIKVPAD
jgi:phosphoserine phosphatase